MEQVYTLLLRGAMAVVRYSSALLPAAMKR